MWLWRARGAVRARCSLIALLACAQLGMPRAALAQPSATEPAPDAPDPAAGNDAARAPASDAPKAALEHYLRGRRWYLAGRYRDALTELKAALEYDRDSPDLLYNVARVYENLGELDPAIEYYEHYLTKLPPEAADERDKTQKTIRRLQGARREVSARPPPKAAAPAPQQAPHAGRADLAFWLTTGAAVALFGGGAATGVLALHQNAKVDRFVAGPDGSLAQRERLTKDAKRFALIADGLFIAGGVAVTSAALLFLLRDSEVERPESALRLGVGMDASRALVQVQGRF